MTRTFSDSLDYDLEAVQVNADEFAVAIAYDRVGGLPATGIAAIKSATRIEELGDYGAVRNEAQLVDWLIPAALLVWDGAAILPALGDTVTETRGATDYVYAVVGVEGGPVYTFDDADHRLLRIHTRLDSSS